MGLNYRRILILSLFLIIFSSILISSAGAYEIEDNDDFSLAINSSNHPIAESSLVLEDNSNSGDDFNSIDSNNENLVDTDNKDDLSVSNSQEDNNLKGSENKSSLDQFLDDIKNYKSGTIYIKDNLVINKPITISKTMIIDGKGHSISSKNRCRIFNINAATTLKNIVFKDASSKSGGAIYSTAKLSINNCQFLNNKASSYGGAIYSVGVLVVKNSKFTNNKAGKSGGAIFVDGKLTLSTSYFGLNKASIFGGALYASGKSATISNSKFERNSVKSNRRTVGGGAIYTLANTKISSSVFNKNFCKYTKRFSPTHQSLGGAIFYSRGNHTIRSSKFNGNRVDNDGGAILVGRKVVKFIVYKSSFISNRANFEDGGAISTVARISQIKSSRFMNNFAKEDGGAIDTYSLTRKRNSFKISNCLFKSNKAYKAAGAIYLGRKTNRVIGHCNFYSNKATIAGCLYMESGYSKLFKCIFNRNSAFKLKKSALYNKRHKRILHAGGCLFNNGSKLKVSSSRFKSNKANSGGVLYNKGKVTLKNSKFTYNSAVLGGGIVTSHKSMKIFRCSFLSNKARSLGGAIYLNSGSMKLYSSTLKSNKARSLGGAIYSYSGSMRLYSSTLRSNKASVSGGALYFKRGKFYTKNNVYYKNKANSNGGALLIHSGRVKIISNTFKSNKAKKCGGAIYITSGKGKVKSNAIISNKAKKFKAVFSESISLGNNWWGKIKKSPYKLNITNVKVKSWLVLKISSSKSKLKKGKSSKIRLTLRYNNKHKKISNIPKLKARFSSKGGFFNIKSKRLKKGLAVVKFTKRSSKKVKVYGKILGVPVAVRIR